MSTARVSRAHSAMVTRVLEVIPNTGASTSLHDLIEEKVRPLLSTAPGYVQLATLAAEGDPGLVVQFSIWNSETDAARYDRDLLLKILDLIQHLVVKAP